MLKFMMIHIFNKESFILNAYPLIIHRLRPLSLVFQEIASDQLHLSMENGGHIHTFNLLS